MSLPLASEVSIPKLRTEIIRNKAFKEQLKQLLFTDMAKHVAQTMFWDNKLHNVPSTEEETSIMSDRYIRALHDMCDSEEYLKEHPEARRQLCMVDEDRPVSEQAKRKAEGQYVLEAIGLAALYRMLEFDAEKFVSPGRPWPENPDALIPVPCHCLQRLLDAVTYSGLVRTGTALHRDFCMTESAITNELRRTNNVKR
jgi:hypothetical protein